MKLYCPQCKFELHALCCKNCLTQYDSKNNIPLLFLNNNEITQIIKNFYEENPFPNYSENETIDDIKNKSKKFARSLKDQIKYGPILEIGCGTGQLSNYLAAERPDLEFVAVDICLNSLKIAEDFRRKSLIDNLTILQMNLFNPVLEKKSFNVVICNGVLHCSSNPKEGFNFLTTLVKKGGFVIIGLYNTKRRKMTYLRRWLFNHFGKWLKFLDPICRNPNISEVKKKSWYADQYEIPHETSHEIQEVIDWFHDADIEFINCIGEMDKEFKLFEKNCLTKDQIIAIESKPNSHGEDFFFMIGQRTI